MIKRTDAEVRLIIENFLMGQGGEWDWDDFISLKISDDYLEGIRKLTDILPKRYPPKVAGQYCNDEGRDKLKIISDLLS